MSWWGSKPRKNGAPKGRAPKGGTPKGGAPKGGAQNFALFFFSPLPPPFSLFFSVSGCLLVEFWWCLKRRSPHMCAFGVLWLLCEALAAPKPPGFHMTVREPKRAHLRVPIFTKTHQNSTRRHKVREKKNEIVAAERKKRAKFWAVRRRVQRKGVRRREGPAQGRNQRVQNNHTNTQHTTHNNNTTTTTQQQHNNNNTQQQHTTTTEQH